MEQWHDVAGFEGLYKVSNHGAVLSLKSGKQMKLIADTYGYQVVTLSKNGKQKLCKIHRLVAAAFIGNPDNHPQVNHLDCKRDNNHVSNLEYCTALHNNRHGVKYGNIRYNRGENPKAKIVLDTQTGIFYDCAHDASEAKGIVYSTLRNKLNGNHRTNKTGLIYG